MPELPLEITETQFYKRMPSYQRPIRKVMEAQASHVDAMEGLYKPPLRDARRAVAGRVSAGNKIGP